jgi:hypothetical protein
MYTCHNDRPGERKNDLIDLMIDCMGEGDQNANEGDIHNSKGRNIDEETIVSTGEIQQMSKLVHIHYRY